MLVKGKEGNIKIEGEENIFSFIETKLSGNTLQIKYKKNTNIQTTKKSTVTVPIINISKISLVGSGNLSNIGIFKSNELSVSLGGSGNIKLQIDTKELNANIGGSGNIYLSGKTTEFNGSIAGSGSIKTTVISKIKGKVVGSGNIYYKGTPSETDLKSVGSGEINNKN
ncbi:head GIN domain-containing protein [Polaribacter sp.]|uniref:head GIN domain-containing protein n=1 Tax=Polaribacter sp. TaxID=1920175 RepID=UPI0040473573